jgi:hypothetical protein
MDTETLTITKSQLEAAMLRWWQLVHDGETRTWEESFAQPVEQAAAMGADYLWQELGAIKP